MSSVKPVQRICTFLKELKQASPLVLNLTNYVVMQSSANTLLAIGASPIMAQSRHEICDLMKVCSGVVFNIGTVDQTFYERLLFAATVANENGHVVVLDPVGAAATPFRKEVSRALMQKLNRYIIRANASEVMALAGFACQSKGVDALEQSEQALEAAQAILNRDPSCLSVVISGATDWIVQKDRCYKLAHGHPLMARVTGSGCALSALTAAFVAVGDTTGLAAAALWSFAGEMASHRTQSPGTFAVEILDQLYQLNIESIEEQIKVIEHA